MIRHYRPDDFLSYWVEYIWLVDFKDLPEELRKDVIMPLGHMNVIFNLKDDYYIKLMEEKRRAQSVAIVGQIDKAFEVYYGASVFQIGIAMKPTAFKVLFDFDCDKYTNQTIEGTPELYELYENLKKIQTPEQKLNLMWDFLSMKLMKHKERNQQLDEMLQYVHTHLIHFRVHEMAEAFEISMITLERRFKKAVGISPKKYANIKRFIRERMDEDYYFDQAHMIKETKRFTTKTPKALTYQTKELTLKYLMDNENLQE